MTAWARLLALFGAAPRSGIDQLRAVADPGADPFADLPAPMTPAPSPASSTLIQRLDSLVNTLTGLGSVNDKGAAGRPDTSRIPLDLAELSVLWRYNGYANHHVATLPREACRKGWKVVDGTSRVDPMARENKRLQVLSKVRAASTWGRLHGGAILLIVCDEITPPPGGNRAPLDPSNIRRVCALQVFDANEARPGALVSDPRSPAYREPEFWHITPGGSGQLRGGFVVHHSRVLYFGGTPLPPSQKASNAYLDDSVLQLSWDAVRDRTSLDQAGAHTAQTLSQDVVTVNDVKDITTGEDSRAFSVRMRLLAMYKSLLNMVVLSGGETFQTTARPLSGFADLANASNEALAAVQNEPMTRLLGQAPSGLNTDGENQRGIWATVVSSYFAEALEPQITYLYHLLYRAAEGPTRGVEPAVWSIELLPLDELTAQGEAAYRKTIAETDALLVQSQILPADHIARSRYSREGYSSELLPYDPDAADAELEAAARAQLVAAEAVPAATPAAAPPPVPAADVQVEAQDDTELLTDEAVSTLAAAMTQHAIPRCEHGANNRCRICGIERIRGLAMDENGTPQRNAEGEPVWSVAWRPITRVGAVP